MKSLNVLFLVVALVAPACTIQTQPAPASPAPAAPAGDEPSAERATPGTTAPDAAVEPSDPFAEVLTERVDASDWGWPVAFRAPAGTSAEPIDQGVLEILLDGDGSPEARLHDVRETNPDRADASKLSSPEAIEADLLEDLGWLRESGEEPYASGTFERGYWIRFHDSEGDAHVEVVLYDLGMRCEGRATAESAIELIQALCVSATSTMR